MDALGERGRRRPPALRLELVDLLEVVLGVLAQGRRHARETGAEIAKATGTTAQPDDRLAPGASTAALRAALDGRGARIVVVGHQPDCGRIAAELTGGAEPAFPAAGMCVIELG